MTRFGVAENDDRDILNAIQPRDNYMSVVWPRHISEVVVTMQKIKNYRLIIASTKDSKEKFHRLKSNSDFTSNVIAYRIIFVRGGPNSIAKMDGGAWQDWLHLYPPL